MMMIAGLLRVSKDREAVESVTLGIEAVSWDSRLQETWSMG